MSIEPNFKWDNERQPQQYVQIAINVFKRVPYMTINKNGDRFEREDLFEPVLHFGECASTFELRLQRIWPKFGWAKRRKGFEKVFNAKVIERRINGVRK